MHSDSLYFSFIALGSWVILYFFFIALGSWGGGGGGGGGGGVNSTRPRWVNSLFPPEKNGRNFADDIFRCTFMNDFFILIEILPKFVPKSPTDNNPALV